MRLDAVLRGADALRLTLERELPPVYAAHIANAAAEAIASGRYCVIEVLADQLHSYRRAKFIEIDPSRVVTLCVECNEAWRVATARPSGVIALTLDDADDTPTAEITLPSGRETVIRREGAA